MKQRLIAIVVLGVATVSALHARGASDQDARRAPYAHPSTDSGVFGPGIDDAFWDGLPVTVLPGSLGGEPIDERRIVRYTTPCGLRTILGVYDDTVLFVLRASDKEDVDAGYITGREGLGSAKAASILNSIAVRTPLPMGHFGGDDVRIGAIGSDGDGIAWLESEGPMLMHWGERIYEWQDRHAYWWRSGQWLFCVDAPTREAMLAAFDECVAYLE